MACDSEPALRLVEMAVKGRENGVLMILERVTLQEKAFILQVSGEFMR